MKNIIITITAFLLAAYTMSAQNDPRDPGLYAIMGDESIPLEYQSGTASDSGTSLLGIVELGHKKYIFKGPSSSVTADSIFVMVCNLEKKHITRTLKKYDIFVESMTPDNIVVIPLEVQKNRRIFSEGTSINGFNTEMKNSLSFEWERLSDNSFLITVHGLVPGEYAFAFRAAKLAPFDFTAIFGFTIPDHEKEDD